MNLIKINTPVLRAFAIFAISFFLLLTLLTSFVLIPKINLAFEGQHYKDSEITLEREVVLLERFIENHRKILQDLSDIPVITNAVLLASAENPDFIDLVENFSISGEKARLVLLDITGERIYQTNQNMIGSYSANQEGIHALLNGNLPYHFQLLEKGQGQFAFSLSIPVKYGASIEGVLCTEITAPLQKVFSPNVIEQGALRLTQEFISAQTNDEHILIPREFSTKLTEPNLTLTYIADDTPVLAAENKLSNTILLTLFAGLGISFCIFALLGYKTLEGGSDTEKTIHKGLFSRDYLIPVIVALIGIAATVAAHMVFKNLQDQKIKQAILSDTHKQIQAIKAEVTSNLQVLHSLKAFYDASSSVEREEFKIFTRALLEHNPNIQALGWNPKVFHGERDDYELQARVDGFSNFNFTERLRQGDMVPASDRDLYFPAYYLEPLQGNEAALGFDLASNAKRLAALHEARDSGKPVATARITLVQEGKEQQAGLLVFNPVYEEASYYNNMTERKKHLKGFVVIVLRLGDMINSALGESRDNIAIHIEDNTDTAENIFGSLPSSSFQALSSSSRLDIAGRQWKVTATPRTEVYKSQQSLIPWFVLISGLLFTAFIAYSLIHHIRRRQIIEGIVELRTKEIQESKLFQDMIMSNIPDFLYVKDDEFRIVQANPAFLSLYPEGKRDGVIGTTSFEDYDAKEVEEFLEHDKRAMLEGYSETEESIQFPDGKDRILFTKKVRFEDIAGNKFVLGVSRDITENKQAEEEILRSNIELERFAYVASHDLQEPLRMVISFTALLEKRYADKLDDKAKEYIAFASNGAIRMQELVLDLLEYARVGQEAEHSESIDGNKTLLIIKENLKESIDTSNALITQDDLPVIVTNPVRFMRVLQNLIGNSLKYQNTESRPEIHISAAKRGDEWLFSVKDNGIGMRQEYCQKIFEPFTRLHGKNKFTGTGIGLAICRKIVEGFGGEIYAESALGEGSTFYFTVPARPTVNVTNETNE